MPRARRFGRYRDRCTRIVATLSQEQNYGDHEATYADGDSFWCEISDSAGDERRVDSQVESRVDVVVTCRQLVTFSVNDRFRGPGGEEYHVVGVSTSGHPRQTILQAYRLSG